jgi:hypothetical protein
MSTVTITGTFKNSSDNNIVIEVYQPTPTGLEFKQSFQGPFVKKFVDLPVGETFYVDFTGHTTGSFDLTIKGNLASPISKTYSSFFLDGLTFETKN